MTTTTATTATSTTATSTTATSTNAIHYYVDGLVYPHFTFFRRGDGKFDFAGNPGMVGDDGEYGSPIALQPGETPESWMLYNVGPADKWR